MTEADIINSYWVGLHRTNKPAPHLHNFYRELFGQKWHKANHVGIYSLVKKYDKEIVFRAICDLLDWEGFTPTTNVIPAIRHLADKRYKHKELSENQPDIVDLSEFIKGLANVR